MKNLNEKIEKIKNQLEAEKTIRIDAHKAIIEVIKEIVAANGGEIEMTELYDEFDILPIAVAYDGGNHPEYDSQMFSEVKLVSINKRGELVFELEDEVDVCYDRLLYDDIVMVFETLVLWQDIVDGMTDNDADNVAEETDIVAEYEMRIVEVSCYNCDRDAADIMQNKHYDSIDEIINDINANSPHQDYPCRASDMCIYSIDKYIENLNDENYPTEYFVIKIYLKKEFGTLFA